MGFDVVRSRVAIKLGPHVKSCYNCTEVDGPKIPFSGEVKRRSIGALCVLFFIVLCNAVVQPFQCQVHPNGLSTMQSSIQVDAQERLDFPKKSCLGCSDGCSEGWARPNVRLPSCFPSRVWGLR